MKPKKIRFTAKDPELKGLTTIAPSSVVLNIGKGDDRRAIHFLNARAAYAYLCQKDPEKRSAIENTLNIKTLNYYTSERGGFEEPSDPKVRIRNMRRVLRAKFVLGHPYFTKLLLSTGNAELIEDRYWEKTDSFWGVAKDGTGENHSGKLLMELRDEIRGSRSPSPEAAKNLKKKTSKK